MNSMDRNLTNHIARAMAGDREAFDELVGRHRRRVFHCCLGMVEHRQDAEDLTADTFLRAWIKRHTYRLEASTTFEAWILAIARNLCRSFLEERKRRHCLQSEKEGETLDRISSTAVASPAGSREDSSWLSLKDTLSREMDLLPASWREAFSMMLEGHSYQEIAESLGVTMNYAGVLINRARRRLQTKLASRIDGTADQFMIANRRERGRAVWGELESKLRGIVTDFKLTTVPINGNGASLQVWVPVQDISRQKTFQEALERLQAATRADPRDGEAWLQLAEMWRAQGDLHQAIDGYRRAVQCPAPRNGAGQDVRVRAWIRLGECLHLVERRTEAAEAYRSALRRLKDPAERYLVQGHLHSLRRRHRKAVTCYEKAVRRTKEILSTDSSEHAVAILNPMRHHLAMAYRSDGRPDLAVREYEAIIRANPCDVDAYDRVADCYRELGAWDKTLEALEKAAEILPHCPRTLRHLAQKLTDTHYQLDRALGLAERAVHLAPNHWESWKTLGQVYRCLGRMGEARGAYEKSIEVGRKVADAWWHYSSFVENVGDWDEILRAALCARRLEPDNPLRMLCLSSVYLQCGNRRAATRWLNRVAQVEPKGWFLSQLTADMYIRLGMRERGIQWARRAVSRGNPAQTLSNLGYVYMTFGEWQKAGSALKRSLGCSPSSAHARYSTFLNLSRCYGRLGDFEKQRRALMKAIGYARHLSRQGHQEPSIQVTISQARRDLIGIRLQSKDID